jgi:hypothetical protein
MREEFEDEVRVDARSNFVTSCFPFNAINHLSHDLVASATTVRIHIIRASNVFIGPAGAVPALGQYVA